MNQAKLIAAFAVLAVAVVADASSTSGSFAILGGGPSPAMGGAGLALPRYIGQSNLLNPGLLGFASRGLSLNFPYFGYLADNINEGDLHDLLSVNHGGISDDKLKSFAQQFGENNTELGLTAGAGIMLGGLAVNVSGEADVTTVPNSALISYEKAGGTGEPSGSEQMDAYGLAYGQASVGYGALTHTKAGKLSVGATAKWITADYAHKVANSDSIFSTGSVENGTDITGTQDTVQKTGFGLDVGTIYSPAKVSNLFLGGVIENLIKPNIKFDEELPNDGALVPGAIDPFKTALDLGAAGILGNRTLVAVDLIDVGNRADRSDLRGGVDFGLVKGVLNLRAGYSTRTSFTVGFSVIGIDFAYGAKMPLTVGSAVHF